MEYPTTEDEANVAPQNNNEVRTSLSPQSKRQAEALAANIGAKLEQGILVVSLRKEIRQLKNRSKKAENEVRDLKRSTKVCVFNELDAQLEAYSDECKRMRSKLEQAHKKNTLQEREM